MLWRDHDRTWQVGRLCQRIELQAHQIGHEQEQATAAGHELSSRRERELPHIGHGFGCRCEPRGSVLVQASRQRGEPLGAQQLANGGWAQRHVALLELLTDLVDRVVLLAQSHGQISAPGFLGLLAWPMHRDDEELWIGIAAELMAKHAKGAGAVAESAGDLLGGAALKKIAPKGFIHALAGLGGFREKAATFCYVFRCSQSHTVIFVHATRNVKARRGTNMTFVPKAL